VSRLTSAQQTLINLNDIDNQNFDRIYRKVLEAVENLQSEAEHSGGNQRLDELHQQLQGQENELTPDELQSIADEAWSISKQIRGPGFDYEILKQ